MEPIIMLEAPDEINIDNPDTPKSEEAVMTVMETTGRNESNGTE
ncbi:MULTISPECIES: hypothetical protein [Blautia]|nr:MULTISPECIES: hypothetical protein [Blautia]